MSEAVFGAILVLAIIGFSIAGSSVVLKYVEGQRECNDNAQCSSLSYCGSDFHCHQFPTVSQTIVEGPNWTTAAAILALAMVMAALILRRR